MIITSAKEETYCENYARQVFENKVKGCRTWTLSVRHYIRYTKRCRSVDRIGISI